MTKQTPIYKLIQRLKEEGALEIENYMNYIEQVNAIYSIIERELDGILLIEGRVIE